MLGLALIAAAASTFLILSMVERPANRLAEHDEASVKSRHAATVSRQPAGKQSTQSNPDGPTGDTDAPKTAAPGGSPPLRRPQRMAIPDGYSELPAERSFLLNGRMNVDAVRSTITSDHFDAVLDQFEQQSRSDVLASQMNQLYRSSLEKQALDHDLSPGRVACGIRFCTGSIMSSDPAAWQRLVDALTGSDDFPLYMFGSHDRPVDSTLTEHRFFFSIDPEIQAATGHLPRHP